MHRRWTVTLAALVCLGALAAGALFVCTRLAPPVAVAPPAALTGLALDAPATLPAGEAFTVTVRASPPLSGTQILLTAQGTSGLLAESRPLRDGVAQFALPAGWAQAAGAATLRAAGGGVSASQAISIEAGAAANPLFTLTGPASAPVAGGEPPLLLSLPLDVFGNPVADGVPVVVRTQPPASGGGKPPAELIRVLTQDLVAAAQLATHSTAGILVAAASTVAQPDLLAPDLSAPGPGAHSLPQSVRLAPAAVQELALTASPASAPAGSELGVALETDLLADIYGNVLPDGVAVFFVTQSSDGSRRWLPAVTVSGRAAADLAPPSAASTVQVVAVVGQAASAPVTVTFTAPAALAPFDLTVTQEEGHVTLVAGPLLTDLGALIPDGAPVTFTLSDPFGGRTVHEVPTQYGFARLTLYAGSLPPGAYHVSAAAGSGAGSQRTFRLPAPQPAPQPAPDAGGQP